MYQFTIDVTGLAELQLAPGQQAAPIAPEMFGAIHSNVLSFGAFAADYEALGLTGLRFPGGSLAENDRAASGEWLYDPVAYESGFHPDHALGHRASLPDMVALAASKGVTLSLTVPVERFFDDPEAGGAWMTRLLERLSAFDGDPPFTLDIGNEAYSDPAAYGAVLAHMLGALREARADGLTGVSAGIQVMKDPFGSVAANAEMLAALQSVDGTLLAEVDAVRMHALDLPIRNAARYEDVRAAGPGFVMDAIEAQGGRPALHVSAWAVRGDDALPADWTGPASAPLAASGAMLSLFASLVELGATRADAWGLAVSEANRTALSFAGEDGGRIYAPHAVTLALMAESVVGLSLVDDGRLDIGSAGPIVQTYVGDGRAVLLLHAGDIDGPTDIAIDLDGVTVTGGWADRVALISGSHAGAAHAVREEVAIAPGGTVSWTFEEDYETVRIELTTVPGETGAASYVATAYAAAQISFDASTGVATVEHGGTVTTIPDAERLYFEDVAVAFDTEGDAGRAYRLYESIFDRTPDLKGLGFWIDFLDRPGTDFIQAAGYMIADAEFTEAYGPLHSLSDADFLSRVYGNILDREPDPDGFAFWLGRLAAGQDRAEVLAYISEDEENTANTAPLIANGILYDVWDGAA